MPSDAISIFNGSTDKNVKGNAPWQDALEAISDGTFEESIVKLRSIENEEARKAFKRTLQAVTFCGTFKGSRSKNNIDTATGFCIADIDHVRDVESLFSSLSTDPYTWFAFRSPSGDGIKCGFRAEGITSDADIKVFFANMEEYFLQAYGVGIDKACKDISRLTYMSHDPAAYINTSAKWFPVKPVGDRNHNTQHDFTFDPGIGEQKYAAKVLESCCQKIRQSLPGDQHRVRLDMAVLAGGYAHYLDDSTVYVALEAAVAASGAEDMRAAMATVRNGIEYGKARPLSVPKREERQGQRATAGKAEVKPEEPARRALRLIPAAEAIRQPSMTHWLVKGIIDADSLASLYGSSATGKSFVMLDMALCIAAGVPWHGRKIAHAGPVVYVAGEGLHGLRKRIRAWFLDHPELDPECVPFFLTSRPVRFLSADDLEIAVSEINTIVEAHGRPKMVVVDTVARCFGDGDENSTADMNAFVDRLYELKQAFECCVFCVHHTGLADQSRARGSSAFRAALDWEYSLAVSDGQKLLACTKAKDCEAPEGITFETEVIDIGWTDEDGDPVTSLVLRKVDAIKGGHGKENDTRPIKGANRVVFNTLKRLATAGDIVGASVLPVDLEDWREACYKESIADSTDQGAKRKAFGRARKWLVDNGHVTTSEDKYWPAGKPVFDPEPLRDQARQAGQDRTKRDTCPAKEGQEAGQDGTHFLRSVPVVPPVPMADPENGGEEAPEEEKRDAVNE